MRHALEEPLGHIGRQGLPRTHHAADAAALRQAGLLQKDAQHRRHEVQHRHTLLANQVHQVGAVAVPFRPRHDEGRTGGQRPEKLPHRNVEAVRCFLHHPICRGEPVFQLHPLQPVHDAFVRIQRALGPPGGTGGEDRIGRVVRRADQLEIARVHRRGLGLVNVHDVHPVRQRSPYSLQLGSAADDDHQARVFAHACQPLARVRRVQRHVGGAAVHHTHQGRDQFGAALQAHAHPRARPGTRRPQLQRQRAGRSVQRAVAQRLIFKHHGHRVARFEHLAANEIAQPQPGLERHVRGVPAGQFGVLGRTHRIHRLHGLCGVGQQLAQHREKAGQHALSGGWEEQVGGIRQVHATKRLVHREPQLELCRHRRVLERFERHARHRLHVERRVDHVEQHLDQRLPVRASVEFNLLHQPLERGVLVGKSLQRCFFDARQQLGQRRVARQVGAHHQRVHQRAHQAFRFDPGAVGHRRADHHVRLAAVAPQHYLEAGQHGHEGRDAVAAAQPPQRFERGCRQAR